MNDASPYGWAGASALPPATLYDPADDRTSPFGSEPAGTMVLLLVGEVDRRWAADAAIEMSAAWAAGGRRVVLADLHLENPVLHEPLEAENLEGVVDVFVYGASIARSARPVRGRGFFFLPAGTYTSDLHGLYHHPRWPKLVSGFREAGASLVLFAPAEGADLSAIAPLVDRAILLGAPRDLSRLDPLVAAGVEPRALVVPPGLEGAPRGAAAPDLTESFPPHAPTVPAPAAPLPAAPRRAEAGLHLPPPPVRAPQRGQRVVRVALLTLLALALVAAVGYALVTLRPELLRYAGIAPDPAVPDSAVVRRRVVGPPPAPTRQGDPLPYSVQVIAYKSFSAASDQLARVREQVPAVLFFTSPEDIQGVPYFKLLAGALPDTALAMEIKGVLVASGVIDEEDAAGDWSLVQPVPLAFDLGEFPTREAALARSDSLLAMEIPTYPVAVPYSDRSQRWQLYGGAYADSSAAEGMRRLLERAGVQAPLVPRTGLSTAAPE